MEFLITYDIATSDSAGATRLRRVAAACEGYGLRVQNSVFECHLSNTSHAELLVEIQDIIDPSTDSFNIYRFPGKLSDSRASFGRPPVATSAGPWIV
jgi:CRISPR-associated protein Cas2